MCSGHMQHRGLQSSIRNVHQDLQSSCLLKEVTTLRDVYESAGAAVTSITDLLASITHIHSSQTWELEV